MWICDRSLGGIAGSNPAGGVDVLSLVIVVCCQKSLRRADHSSRGVLPTVVCIIGCDLETCALRRPRLELGFSATEKYIVKFYELVDGLNTVKYIELKILPLVTLMEANG